VSGSLSVLRVVRVEHALVHVLVLGNAGHEEPQGDHDEDALPHGRGNIVPHLLVEEMDLLHALQVVLSRRGVG
jgi:hypothetical protein